MIPNISTYFNIKIIIIFRIRIITNFKCASKNEISFHSRIQEPKATLLNQNSQLIEKYIHFRLHIITKLFPPSSS